MTLAPLCKSSQTVPHQPQKDDQNMISPGTFPGVLREILPGTFPGVCRVILPGTLGDFLRIQTVRVLGRGVRSN